MIPLFNRQSNPTCTCRISLTVASAFPWPRAINDTHDDVINDTNDAHDTYVLLNPLILMMGFKST